MKVAYFLPLLLIGASPELPTKKCEPAQQIPPTQLAKLAPGSTYTNDDEPPARFLVPLKGHVKVKFGREAIEEHCGVPPCNMIFLGCIRNDLMVLPDPTHKDFAKITRHEIAHFNGWPATHGD